jgi:hypothetical protein
VSRLKSMLYSLEERSENRRTDGVLEVEIL